MGSFGMLARRALETESPIMVQIQELYRSINGATSLAQGVVHWQPPKQALTKVKELVFEPKISRYGADEGIPELRNALMQKLHKENKLNKSKIMVTAGANQAFVNLVLTLCDAGDSVIMFAPYYFNAYMSFQMTGVNNILVGPGDPKSLYPDAGKFSETNASLTKERYGNDLSLPKIIALRKTVPVEEILTINIKPGWKKGTKITFPEKGNEQPGVIPADLVFIIDEKPHNVFTRDGNNLVMTQTVTLTEALTGYTVHLTTLDGRNLTIPINSVIHPDYEELVPKEGMPMPKDPSKKGNLRIKFNIKFPSRLTSEQKAGMKKLLAS